MAPFVREICTLEASFQSAVVRPAAVSWRCCGTSVCGEGWMQGSPYDPIAPSQTHDILWCQTDETQAYTCTMAQIISDECDVHEARASGEGLRFDDDARHRTLLHDVLVDEGYAP